MRDYKQPNKQDLHEKLSSERIRVIAVRTTSYTLNEIQGRDGSKVLRAGIQLWREQDGALYLHLSEPYRDPEIQRDFEMFCAGFDASVEGCNGEYTSKTSRELTEWLAEQFQKETGMPAPKIVEGA